MSARGDRVYVAEQYRLDGGLSVLEIHEGRRTRVNALECPDRRAAAAAIEASIALNGAELIAGTEGDLARPCPCCGATGDAKEVFGFRLVRGRRRRQSWCRACRSGATGHA